MDIDKALSVLRAMEREGVDYILVGGLAIGVHGLERATRDIDLFVAPSAENFQRIQKALRSVWNDPEIDSIHFDETIRDYATIRYFPPDESLTVDLITRLGDAVRYEDLIAERLEVDGIMVSVASPATLYRMKRDTIRPQDRVDAAKLKHKFGLED